METTINTTNKQIGDTLFIIESAVSTNAKETALDKLKRLIQNDTNEMLVHNASQCVIYLDFFAVVREYVVPLEDCQEGGKHEK